MSNTEKPLSADVVELQKSLQKLVKLNKKTGEITTPEDAYTSLLPEGMEKGIKEFQKFNSNFTAAAAAVVGDLGIEAFKANDTITRVETTFPMVGKDKLNVAFDKSIAAPKKSADGTVTNDYKYGQLTVELINTSTKGGSFGQVKKSLAAKAMAEFGEPSAEE